ncbi:MAG: hypothetical protein V4590_07675 [Bacteroidota bacterium]
MSLKVISISLFLLFCVVIAFPGYGKPRTIAGNKATTVIKASERSVYSLLLKCLSSGINMIEEERTSEHEDDDNAADEVFVPSHVTEAVIITFSLSPYSSGALFAEQLAFTFIFSPPDLR